MTSGQIFRARKQPPDTLKLKDRDQYEDPNTDGYHDEDIS
jgi:hypothetical protein